MGRRAMLARSILSVPSRMRRLLEGGLLLVALALGSTPASGAETSLDSDIIVTARMAPLDVEAERSLDSDDVEAYGVGTVAELIAEIAAEDGEKRDDPVFLINGKRVFGLGSAADLPPEAVVRLDVLPAGSGLKLGATSRQRVYNIQLRRTLDLGTARAGARVATRGGWTSRRGDVSYTHIRAERRIVLAAKNREDAALLESERDLIQPTAAPADAGRFRTLSPADDRLDLSLAAADQLTAWLSGSLNSKFSLAHRHSLLGPSAPAIPASGPLDQDTRNLSALTDLTLSAQLGRWQGSLFANHAYLQGRTATDRPVAGSPQPSLASTRSNGHSLGALVNLFGPAFELPAGPVMLNVGAGVTFDRIRGRREADAVVVRHARALTSTSLNAGIEVPIASAAEGVLAPLRDLSVSAEFSQQHVSDFGSFQDYTLSSLWRPSRWLSLSASISRSASAPPVATLDEPPIETPGIRYFDPVRAETVEVTRITGGTPGLGRQRDERIRLSANLGPFKSLPLRISADYLERRDRNLVSELPPASLAILEFFPDRFVRDAGGRLIEVDARPISFASRTERQIRTGFVLNLPLRKGRGRGESGALADDDDEAGEKPPTRKRAGSRPRLQLSVSHSWLLESKLRIRPGQPAIDLLSREAVGLGGLGQPRHRIDANLGYAERGLGVRATAQSRRSSFIEASGATPNLLRFEPLTTFSLRAWVQGERLAPRSAWLKGTRVSLSVLNVTDSRERVRDRFGVTPLSYQLAYRDPIGRSIELEFRKKF